MRINNVQKKLSSYYFFSFLIYSCNSDDDICLSGDTTPRLKVKFKTKDGKLKTLDSILCKGRLWRWSAGIINVKI